MQGQSDALNLICTVVFLRPVWFEKASVTQQETFALITQREMFPFVLNHFHLIHVESQSSYKERHFPNYE